MAPKACCAKLITCKCTHRVAVQCCTNTRLILQGQIETRLLHEFEIPRCRKVRYLDAEDSQMKKVVIASDPEDQIV